MFSQSILVYNIFYINRIVFSVLSQNIGESANFVTFMEHSWYIFSTHTQSVVILYVIVGLYNSKASTLF